MPSHTFGRKDSYPYIPGIPGTKQCALGSGQFRPLVSRRMVQEKQPAHHMHVHTYIHNVIRGIYVHISFNMYSDRHVLSFSFNREGSVRCAVL